MNFLPVARPRKRRYIGSADAPILILGTMFGRSALDVWSEASGRPVPERPFTAMMEWGLILEPVLIARLAQKTGVRAYRRRRLFVHPERPWMRAHVDATDEEGRIIEAKTSPMGGDQWGDPGDPEGVPAPVRVQVQHQLAVTGAREAIVPVLIRGYDFRTYPVVRDEAFIADLLDEEDAFWYDHVQTGVPPDIDGSESWDDRLRRLHPYDDGSALIATPEQALLAMRLRAARAASADAAREEALITQRLMDIMGPATSLAGPGFRITWKAHQRRDVQWKEVAAEYRDLLALTWSVLAASGADSIQIGGALVTLDHEALQAPEAKHATVRIVRPFAPKFADDPQEE